MRIRPLLLSAAIVLAGTRNVSSQPAPAGLTGYVELHAHPLANVGFGGKLVYGGPDIGSLLPSDPDCNRNVRATTMLQALGHDRSTHGGWLPFTNPCGDSIREQVIHVVQTENHAADESSDALGLDALGLKDFTEWPVWNDLTHQKMWIDWIRRAYDDGENDGHNNGHALRVMVALSVNNKTLADAVCGPCDGPTDDKASADLQLAEIKGLVSRHPDFMEIALTADDLARINKANRLAVVLGMEVDNFGNFKPGMPPSDAQIKAEIDRLYAEGVRYIFPVHLLDNAFGGTATYVDLFNFSTVREDGDYWHMDCGCQPGDPKCVLPSQTEAINYRFSPFPVPIELVNIVASAKLKTTFPPVPTYPECGTTLSAQNPTFTVTVPAGQPSAMINTLKITLINGNIALDTSDTVTATLQFRDGSSLPPITLKAAGTAQWKDNPPKLPTFPLSAPVDLSTIAKVTLTLGTINPRSLLLLQDLTVTGFNDDGLPHPTGLPEATLARSAFGLRNVNGLSTQGHAVLAEIMRHGMLIDIDHMSDMSKTDAIADALKVSGGYPLNSGHSSPRGFFPSRSARNASDVNERSTSLSQYQAIAQLHGMAGIGTGNQDAQQLVEMYQKVFSIMQPLQSPVSLGIGTDTDGFAPGMPPRCDPPINTIDPTDSVCGKCINSTDPTCMKKPLSSVVYTMDFPKSMLGKMSWDYNTVGVAHYGMLADFRKDMATVPSGAATITNMDQGAEYFFQTWKICEDRKNKVP